MFLFYDVLFSEAHTLSQAHSWSDTVNKLMNLFRDSLRARCISLVANGYSSIKKHDLAAILGILIYKHMCLCVCMCSCGLKIEYYISRGGGTVRTR